MSVRRRSSQALVMTLLVAQFAACGSDGPMGTTGSVASVAVTPGSANLTALGLETQFQAVAKDAAGNTLSGKSFSWASTATDVATVNPTSGLATAVANGTTTIQATTDGVRGTASLTVAQAVATVEVTPAAATLVSLLETIVLTGRARDANGNTIVGQTFAWSSSDESVATVSSGSPTALAGLATAVANGSATITATADGVQGAASLTVAQAVATVEVTPADATVDSLGETFQLTARASDAAGNTIAGKTFTWSSSDESIATVTDSGLVTALASGWVTITAATDDVRGKTEFGVTTSPPGLDFSAMAYDAESDRVILYGAVDSCRLVGTSYDCDYLNYDHTWAYDYNTNDWTDMEPATGPPTLGHAAMAYDAESDRVILFGGKKEGGPLNVTWAYDFNTNTWTRMNPTSSPAIRFAHRMVYDARSDRIILFGGWDYLEIYYDDTWAYDFNTNAWTQLSPSTKPDGRLCFAMAYDAESGRVIVFAGDTNDRALDETWAYDFNTNAWTDMNPATNPGIRSCHAMAYDAQSDRVILFGGFNNPDGDQASDTWAYDFNTNSWTEMNPVVHPSGRFGHMMAYDEGSDRVVLFGGRRTPASSDETWVYDFNTDTWTQEVQ